jgi:hypothetical protein
VAKRVIIGLDIDVTKINKERLKRAGKGCYLHATLIETPDSDYGDFMIVEDLTKAEREADKNRKGTILGNAKIRVGKIVVEGEETTTSAPAAEPSGPPVDDDIPF